MAAGWAQLGINVQQLPPIGPLWSTNLWLALSAVAFIIPGPERNGPERGFGGGIALRDDKLSLGAKAALQDDATYEHVSRDELSCFADDVDDNKAEDAVESTADIITRSPGDYTYRIVKRSKLATYPFSAVGIIETPKRKNGIYNRCTASLVGPRHVLTGRHCPVNKDTVFYLAWYDNSFTASAHVVERFRTPSGCNDDDGGQCVAKTDIAILVIDQRLGDTHGGFYPTETILKSYAGDKIFKHISYPESVANGARSVYQTDISITRGNCGRGPLKSSSMLSAPGASGGPLWKWADDDKTTAIVVGPLYGYKEDGMLSKLFGASKNRSFSAISLGRP
ncbi:Uu.00g015660.m01.CDS01 [Anthostomella pinea]|uniref:Uu.00g015660.m01.CDS01 n=1 Tax=Anthostomella pinea TaxID=933095 RepID=A0AAI8VYK2_9PEZI|nr:Uu.00g015660.m01.CDS01 [Anthostomella pinea]